MCFLVRDFWDQYSWRFYHSLTFYHPKKWPEELSHVTMAPATNAQVHHHSTQGEVAGSKPWFFQDNPSLTIERQGYAPLRSRLEKLGLFFFPKLRYLGYALDFRRMLKNSQHTIHRNMIFWRYVCYLLNAALYKKKSELANPGFQVLKFSPWISE